MRIVRPQSVVVLLMSIICITGCSNENSGNNSDAIDLSQYKNPQYTEVLRDHSHVKVYTKDAYERIGLSEGPDGNCSSIDGEYTNIEVTDEESAHDSLWSVHKLLGIDDPYKELSFGTDMQIYVEDEGTYSFEQIYKGYRVEGAILWVKIPANTASKDDYSVSGYIIPTSNFNNADIPNDIISMKDLEKAVKNSEYTPKDKFEVTDVCWVRTRENNIYYPNKRRELEDSEMRLAFNLDLGGHWRLYVDVETGEVIGKTYDGPIF